MWQEFTLGFGDGPISLSLKYVYNDKDGVACKISVPVDYSAEELRITISPMALAMEATQTIWDDEDVTLFVNRLLLLS